MYINYIYFTNIGGKLVMVKEIILEDNAYDSRCGQYEDYLTN